MIIKDARGLNIKVGDNLLSAKFGLEMKVTALDENRILAPGAKAEGRLTLSFDIGIDTSKPWTQLPDFIKLPPSVFEDDKTIEGDGKIVS